MRNEYFTCGCSSPEHLVVMQIDPTWEEYPITINCQMYQWQGFWKRLWYGMKWIFTGQGSIEWDSTLLTKEDVRRLLAILKEV